MTRSRNWVYIPLAIFVVLAGLLAYSLRHSGEDRPSAQLNRPFPAFQLPALDPAKTTLLDASLMKGRVTLVNVWGSWCPNCEEEMDELNALAREHVAIVGINYKDESDDARTFLQRFGNPYDVVIDDHAGDLAFELGVYGAPETFVVDANGVIRYHHAGALTPERVAQEITPLLKALAP